MAEPRRTPSLSEARGWVGHQVDDAGGTASARSTASSSTPAAGEPTWLIVKQGRFGGSLVAVPLRDCAAAAGRVWAAHPRETIRSAPVVDPTRPLLREHELTICAHYGIGESVGRAAEVAGPRRARGHLASPPGS